jgi:hypothetical protein
MPAGSRGSPPQEREASVTAPTKAAAQSPSGILLDSATLPEKIDISESVILNNLPDAVTKSNIIYQICKLKDEFGIAYQTVILDSENQFARVTFDNAVSALAFFRNTCGKFMTDAPNITFDQSGRNDKFVCVAIMFQRSFSMDNSFTHSVQSVSATNGQG